MKENERDKIVDFYSSLDFLSKKCYNKHIEHKYGILLSGRILFFIPYIYECQKKQTEKK